MREIFPSPPWEPGYEVEDTRENFNFPSAVNYVTNQIWHQLLCHPTRQKPAQSKALTLQDECKMNWSWIASQWSQATEADDFGGAWINIFFEKKRKKKEDAFRTSKLISSWNYKTFTHVSLQFWRLRKFKPLLATGIKIKFPSKC